MPQRRPRHVLGASVNRPPSFEGTERQTGPQLARGTAAAEAGRNDAGSRSFSVARRVPDVESWAQGAVFVAIRRRDMDFMRAFRRRVAVRLQ
jgi:hypothetical protein